VTENIQKNFSVECPSCKLINIFHQPYPYHAGFGNQGFLYNEAGNLTLVWSVYDPAYVAIVGGKNAWVLTAEDQKKFENQLLPAPDGGKWRFCNPPRCRFCSYPIGEPIGRDIYYYLYDGSIVTHCIPNNSLARYLQR
jgi:hypothetical protein